MPDQLQQSERRCWCCTPIGPARPEPLRQRTVEELEVMAEELTRLYYKAHTDEETP